MTETPAQPRYPHQPQPQWTPPNAAPPPAPAEPPRRRMRRGTVAAAAVVTLAAGALGGTVGAFVGGDDSTPAVSTSAAAAQTAAATSTASATDVSAVVARVLPSVVQVNVGSGNQRGIGSGVILSADGKILTNNHVVSGADTTTVTFSDGRTVDAEVVKTDPSSDLAVLQAKGVSGLTPATLGDSNAVRVGDAVIAIGSPAGLQGTVTTGIVSALDREVNVPAEEQQSPIPYARNGSSTGTSNSTVSYHAIQTDASINQGNSGGPLFDTAGQVIGINSAMYSPVSGPGGSAGSVGIGFAIPVDTAKQIIG
ncbi:MAG: S1C family serine protease [Labedaea sp.]